MAPVIWLCNRGGVKSLWICQKYMTDVLISCMIETVKAFAKNIWLMFLFLSSDYATGGGGGALPSGFHAHVSLLFWNHCELTSCCTASTCMIETVKAFAKNIWLMFSFLQRNNKYLNIIKFSATKYFSVHYVWDRKMLWMRMMLYHK